MRNAPPKDPMPQATITLTDGPLAGYKVQFPLQEKFTPEESLAELKTKSLGEAPTYWYEIVTKDIETLTLTANFLPPHEVKGLRPELQQEVADLASKLLSEGSTQQLPINSRF